MPDCRPVVSWLLISTCLHLTTSASAQTTPSSAVAATQSVPTRTVTLQTLLNESAKQFGITIVQPVQFNQRVIVEDAKAKNADEAGDIIDTLLLTRGYTIQESKDSGITWQIVPATPKEMALGLAAEEARVAHLTMKDAATKTVTFQFADVPIEEVLDKLSVELGIEIDRPAPVPGRITVNVPKPVTAEEAVKLLNTILAPSKYVAIEVDRKDARGNPRPAVRIGTFDDAKKGAIPVD
jgi:hypothetical protein